MKIVIVSLLIGIIIGFCAQRSRMCFIGGWRDFFLIRDTYLLKGFFSFVIASAVFFFICYAMGEYVKDYPWFNRPPATYTNVYDAVFYQAEYAVYRNLGYCDLTFNPIFTNLEIPIPGVNIGSIFIPTETLLFMGCAFVIGLFSTIANGCPVRQHVMAASGNVSAMVFLLFFYGGIIIYEKYIVNIVNDLINF